MLRPVLAVFFISLFYYSCEEVVEVDLIEGKKELVVEANIDWIQGTKGDFQRIVLSETSGYFKKEHPRVSGALVSLEDSKGTLFSFKEDEKGNYLCRTFIPHYNEKYTLKISNKRMQYEAMDILRSPLRIYNVKQTSKGGLKNEDKEIYIYFTVDQSKETEFFLIKARDTYNELPFYFVLDGSDFQDKKYFVVGTSEDWKRGDTLEFEFYHISKNYFNYMSRLLAVANKYAGKPLTTPAARVQGNVKNVTESANNPLGAFRVTSCLKATFIVE